MDVHGRTDSAVLAPLFVDAAGELHAVFTRRRHDLRRHPGEISFPGGRQDPGETLIETAPVSYTHLTLPTTPYV